MKKVKKWLRENLQQEFVIARSRHLGWKVYLVNKAPKKVRVLGPAELLLGYGLVLGCIYTTRTKRAKQYCKLVGRALVWWLQRRSGGDWFFKVIPSAHAAFIPGLESPVIKSSVGVISFEN